jgi:hypothetical protein
MFFCVFSIENNANQALEPIAARWAAPAQLFVIRVYFFRKSSLLSLAGF